MNLKTQEFPFTVFVVDDDESICEAICNLLDSEGIPSRSFETTEAFLLFWKEDVPGCLVLDVRLPGVTGVELQERLLRANVHVPIIFMTAHGDIPMVRKVLKAGAVEFLTKPFQKEELLSAIQQAYEIVLARYGEDRIKSELKQRYATLSAREREVMQLVVEGVLNKQIAAQLNLSEITVKIHRRHVMEKMQASSLADLVKIAGTIKQNSSSL